MSGFLRPLQASMPFADAGDGIPQGSAAPVRAALVGLGLVAQQIHLPACALASGIELVAGCDPRLERRDWAQSRGLPATYDDAVQMLDAVRPQLVIIATPPDSHAELCLAALARGMDVLCEKPFAASLDEADAIVAAARGTGRMVVVNNQYRHMTIYRQVREAIARGEFGRPYLIQAWQQMFHPPSHETNWRAGLVRSTLFEFGSHPLDLFAYFFDAQPMSITAHMPRVREDSAADLLVQASLRYPGERLATLLMNRVSAAPERYLEMRIDCEHASVRVSFGGVARVAVNWSRARRRPVFRASLVRGGEARVERDGTSKVLAREATEARPRATAALLSAMADDIRAGRRSLAGAEQARATLRAVLAGYESAAAGQTIALA